ncbi:unnamed protein product, partial [Mesorhabditis belari]|uniref:BTB domain-containing protein n=1 Tax=Mesorhabditis belari TaxID=2138241 RepID=A0AAF3FK82_9BILA
MTYSQFAERTPLRQFEIRASDGSLFVNAHYISELSPYFYRCCFDVRFKECREGFVLIPDVVVDDLSAMLEFICPDENFELKRDVNDDNVCQLLNCAYRFDVALIKQELDDFLEKEILKKDMKIETIINLLLVAENYPIRDKMREQIHRKLGSFGATKINEATKDLPNATRTKFRRNVERYVDNQEKKTESRSIYQSRFNWNDPIPFGRHF